MIYLIKFVLTIIFMGLTDALYAIWARRVTDGKAIQSGVVAAGLIMFNSLAAVLYVNDPSLIPAAMIGAFVGTWLAVRKDRLK